MSKSLVSEQMRLRLRNVVTHESLHSRLADQGRTIVQPIPKLQYSVLSAAAEMPVQGALRLEQFWRMVFTEQSWPLKEKHAAEERGQCLQFTRSLLAPHSPSLPLLPPSIRSSTALPVSVSSPTSRPVTAASEGVPPHPGPQAPRWGVLLPVTTQIYPLAISTVAVLAQTTITRRLNPLDNLLTDVFVFRCGPPMPTHVPVITRIVFRKSRNDHIWLPCKALWEGR